MSNRQDENRSGYACRQALECAAEASVALWIRGQMRTSAHWTWVFQRKAAKECGSPSLGSSFPGDDSRGLRQPPRERGFGLLQRLHSRWVRGCTEQFIN